MASPESRQTRLRFGEGFKSLAGGWRTHADARNMLLLLTLLMLAALKMAFR